MITRRRALAAAAAASAAAAPGAWAQTLRAPGTIQVLGVGDIMLGSDYPTPVMDPKVTPTSDPAATLGAPLAATFRGAAVVFGNMEGTVHELRDGAKRCGNPRFCYTFRSPPFHAAFLRRAGFNMMSVANNHAGDFGDAGRLATVENLRRAGLNPAGIDRDGMRTSIMTLQNGARVGLAAFGHNPGMIHINDIARAQAVIRPLKQQVDLVIVSFHGGGEGANAHRVPRAVETFLGENRGDVYRFARAAVDAGGDIVFGHGPHVPRAVNVYRGRFIAYSLGNFWTFGRFNLNGLAGTAPVADLAVERGGRLVAARIISCRQTYQGGPTLDPAGEAAKAIAAFTARDFPESRLTFEADGRIRFPASA
jgi:hypothetical protein